MYVRMYSMYLYVYIFLCACIYMYVYIYNHLHVKAARIAFVGCIERFAAELRLLGEASNAGA